MTCGGKMLKSLHEQAERDRAALVDRLRENPCDGAIKLYVTSEALRFRREHRDLFAQGSYTALAAEGSRARHVVAFSRATAHQTLIAVTGRFFLKLCNSHSKPDRRCVGQHSHRASQEDRAPKLSRYFHRRNHYRGRARRRPVSPSEQGLLALPRRTPVRGERGLMERGAGACYGNTIG